MAPAKEFAPTKQQRKHAQQIAVHVHCHHQELRHFEHPQACRERDRLVHRKKETAKRIARECAQARQEKEDALCFYQVS